MWVKIPHVDEKFVLQDHLGFVFKKAGKLIR